MAPPDPAHHQESRQERQRRLDRASQARARKKRTVSSNVFFCRLVDCNGLIKADRLAPESARRRNAVEMQDAEQPRLACLS